LPARLMLGLLYLKYADDLSDEAVVQCWMENPYWQHFCGEVFFQTRLPCDPSSLTRYRKHLGEVGVEELLAQTISAAKDLKAIRPPTKEMPWHENTQSGIFRNQPTRCTSELNSPRNVHFADFLVKALGTEVGNLARDGGGFAGSMTDFLRSDSSQASQWVIWEIPERFLEAPLGPEEQALQALIETLAADQVGP